MANTKKLSFEEALRQLEASAEMLKKEGVTLEEAMKSYEEGILHYNQCADILNEAKQKIEIFSK